MCILLNVKKHEKTFALNVDIFTILTLNSKDFAKSVRYAIILFRIRLSLHGDGWTYE